MVRSEPIFERVVFIIGAGHSISAGAPSTAKLTAEIIDGSVPVDLFQWSPRKTDLLKRVADHLDKSEVEPTYESIFTWLWTSYFSDDRTSYRSAWDSEDPFEKIKLKRSEIGKDAYDTLRCIEESVWQALKDEELEPDEAPTLVLQAVCDPCVGQLTLLTLNHDLLLEHLLSEAGHIYCDGFESCAGNLPMPAKRYASWSSSRPDTRRWDRSIQLIKMHGSIDWWSPQGWNDAGVVYRTRKPPPEELGCGKLPLLLVGTGPKLFQSSNLMFARQILDAGHALSRATCVIVIGYGFGDVRMNSLWSGAIERSLGDDRRGDPLRTLIIDTDPHRPVDYVRKTKRHTGLLGLLENAKLVSSITGEAVNTEWEKCRAEIETLAH